MSEFKDVLRVVLRRFRPKGSEATLCTDASESASDKAGNAWVGNDEELIAVLLPPRKSVV